MITIEQFNIIGIAIKTQNIQGKADVDIPNLWATFMQQNYLDRIPNKVNNDIYCIYTNYEGDFTAPYTAIIGCKTSNLDEIPEGMVRIVIKKGEYKKFIAKGKVFEGVVSQVWQQIWQSNIDRSYQADFEVYKENLDYNNAKVDIYVGVNSI